MFYAASTNGFYEDLEAYPALPDDLQEISKDLYASLLAGRAAGLQIRVGDDGLPALFPFAPGPRPTPTSVTMRQARLALLAAGEYTAVQTAVASASDAVRIDWEFAATVDRGSPTVALLAQALGLSGADLDALFNAAGLL